MDMICASCDLRFANFIRFCDDLLIAILCFRFRISDFAPFISLKWHEYMRLKLRTYDIVLISFQNTYSLTVRFRCCFVNWKNPQSNITSRIAVAMSALTDGD